MKYDMTNEEAVQILKQLLPTPQRGDARSTFNTRIELALLKAIDILSVKKPKIDSVKSLHLDYIIEFLNKNSIKREDVIGIYQEEIFKSYGEPVYQYTLIYFEKGAREEKDESM